MSTVAELEKEILGLKPAERERLAAAAWESLEKDTAALIWRTPKESALRRNETRRLRLEKQSPSVMPSSGGAPVGA